MAPYRYSLIAMLALVILASFLYLPFLHNGLIFDDQGLFSSGVIYDYAQTPFDFRPRTFPYFTLGFASVVGGTIEGNRVVSLALHILCAWVLYLLLRALLTQALNISRPNEDAKQTCRRATIFAFLGATWFAIHPIAVYGAGYLAQRTILFATLFSLLSLWFFRRAFAENRAADVITAALFYAMALFSKEHAIMLPLAAVALASLYEGSFRSHFKRIALYLLLCLPVAVTVFLSKKHIVSTSYEPDAANIIPQLFDIAIMSKPWGQWVVSMVMQAGFFFDYITFWIVPDVRVLSVDMRFDFSHIWFSWHAFPKVIFFLLSPILVIYFLRQKGVVALFCGGFLYCWFLFLTELSSVRFQEPFVLYRSYLWAPGYVMMFVALCARVSIRWLVITAIPVFVVCFLLARDRLTSFATEAIVWKDAASKLESASLIGSDRIYYNRGRAYLQEKRYVEAIDDFSRTIQMSPKVYQAYYNRALASYALKQNAAALQDLDRAALLNQKDNLIQYVRGLVLEQNGCADAAVVAYSTSLALGNKMAQLKLDSLAQKTPRKEIYLSSDMKCPA
ncbi:tetratricopeptide repeat protein [Herminiimonas fonticola]|uniref:Tetratricopeptide repeat protein n=1 Tax=Herminiimonas fonticola TaxID=303380 RepID=A0A4V3BWG1_9BURK|nr:tetratricopeptide repeat protein [Herminiimonas fonticola]RBA25293.1 TPR repeat [Herminiimonas fonticola]TDN94408.1 tetratricopeptide repeat protein [Herminiimonas fonticola]